ERLDALDSGNDAWLVGVPVLGSLGAHADQCDLWVVAALGEPCLDHGVPEIVDELAIVDDLGRPRDRDEALVRLEARIDLRMRANGLDLVARVLREEPEVTSELLLL